jgi:hypothetical protein
MNHTQRSLRKDKIFTSVIFTAGFVLLIMVAAIMYYLAHEGRYAFNRKFDYGFRFAAQSAVGTPEPIEQDPNATVIASSVDATQGPDDKEAGILMPTLEELAGGYQLATGTSLTGDPAKVNLEELYKDDWRPSTTAETEESALIYAFATPEYKGDKMKLAWAPDVDFAPKSSPRNYRLTLVSAPNNFKMEPIELGGRPTSSIEFPTYIAQTDADRTKGYVFRFDVVTNKSQTAAVLGDFFSSQWLTGVTHVRYGVLPLLASTLLMTRVCDRESSRMAEANNRTSRLDPDGRLRLLWSDFARSSDSENPWLGNWNGQSSELPHCLGRARHSSDSYHHDAL